MGNQKMVDAIEEGKIVHVSEDYAHKEGLLILRKSSEEIQQAQPAGLTQRALHTSWKMKKDLTQFEVYRRPLRVSSDDILASLVDHFHWIIREERQKKNLSRKHLAQTLNVSEHELKMLENGVLPTADYVLVSKVEQYFGISLRKSGMHYNKPMIPFASSFTSNLENKNSVSFSNNKKESSSIEQEDILGEGIEIVDEEEQ